MKLMGMKGQILQEVTKTIPYQPVCELEEQQCSQA